jgi:hypothetical protein
MHEALIEMTDTLNGVLAEENALLDALDLPAAVGLLDVKTERRSNAGWRCRRG